MSAARKLIEFFNINIRNERFSLSNNDITVRCNNETVGLVNLSESGISIESDKQLEVKNQTSSFQIFHLGNRLLELNAEVVWSNQQNEKFQYAFCFTDEILAENFVQNLKLSSDIFQELKEENGRTESLLPEFLINCSLLKDSLIKLKNKCESYEKINYIQSLDTKNASIELAVELFGKFAIDLIKKYAHNLDKSLNKIVDKEVRVRHAEYFKNHLGEYFIAASFTGRAYHKPRGYAGDYEMMNQIYRNAAEGQTLFEKIIHLYGINEASSISVRLRKDYLKRKLFKLSMNSKSNSITIGSLACGPGREILEFLSEESVESLKKFKIVLMDQDHHALLNARRNILKVVRLRKLECEVSFLPLSVKQILDQSEEAEVLKYINFDLLYTAGLYDYLPQAVAKNLTSIISGSVSQGGELIIGNFHPDNPTKTISDLVADWRLIHRNQEQMQDLISTSSFKKSQFYLDEIGIDLFIEAYK